MTEHSKKHGFLGRTARFFTRENRDIYDAFHFQEPEQTGDETWPALEAPAVWSPEAAGILADEAALRSIPARTRAIEENTVPSWLWRRVAQGNAREAEWGAKQIFDRVVGSAAYAGWKQDLFADESEARAFYDETRAMLMQRAVALEPRLLVALGVEWAYENVSLPLAGRDRGGGDTLGDLLQTLELPAKPHFPPPDLPHEGGGTLRVVDISNAMIDAVVRGVADKNLRAKWRSVWSGRGSAVTLRLSDIAEDWGAQIARPPSNDARAMIDLMAFRHPEGSVNIEKLRHAVRLIVILLDLHGDRLGTWLDIGTANLAPFLMASGLAYDSNAARAVAAAVNAVITAEAYATSAELAGLRGVRADYVENRESILRALRNHRRAAYGDRNDYEKISVLPAPLMLDHCPDLALVAMAQRRWEDALGLVRQHGLRHTQVTSLFASPALALFMESAAQGIEPVASLTLTRAAEGGLFRQDINPCVTEALTQLGYDKAASRGIIRHIAGAGTLGKAPGINHAALRARGFDDAALDRAEDYLRYVNDIRLAFTPWILSEEFYRKALEIPAAKMANPSFDLLRHLGFSLADIDAANTFCYGSGSAAGAKELRRVHIPVLARADEVSPEARILMAAAVQGFVSGDVGLTLSLPKGTPAERNEFLLLAAWRQGVKSLTMAYDAAPVAEKPKARSATMSAGQTVKKAAGKIRTSEFLHTKSPTPMPARGKRLKAGSGLVSSVGRGKGKSSSSTRGKRG